MQFKWSYYVEYLRSNGIFNIKNNDEILGLTGQCPKLRVHPAPEVHDFAVGCMEF